MAIKEELIKATQSFDVVKILNEMVLNEADPMTPLQIANELGTSRANIERAIRRGMGKFYDDIKKQLKANPMQVTALLIDYYKCEANEVLGYLPPEKRLEVEEYVKREHGPA